MPQGSSSRVRIRQRYKMPAHDKIFTIHQTVSDEIDERIVALNQQVTLFVL